jgi:hypothetical protein
MHLGFRPSRPSTPGRRIYSPTARTQTRQPALPPRPRRTRTMLAFHTIPAHRVVILRPIHPRFRPSRRSTPGRRIYSPTARARTRQPAPPPRPRRTRMMPAFHTIPAHRVVILRPIHPNLRPRGGARRGRRSTLRLLERGRGSPHHRRGHDALGRCPPSTPSNTPRCHPEAHPPRSPPSRRSTPGRRIYSPTARTQTRQPAPPPAATTHQDDVRLPHHPNTPSCHPEAHPPRIPPLATEHAGPKDLLSDCSNADAAARTTARGHNALG